MIILSNKYAVTALQVIRRSFDDPDNSLVTGTVEIRVYRIGLGSCVSTKPWMITTFMCGNLCNNKKSFSSCHMKSTVVNSDSDSDHVLLSRFRQLLNLKLGGTLSPDLARLSYMEILDVMWNKVTGSIPKEIGELANLRLLLLNGNQLTGSLPEEIGNLPNLDRIQIDQNFISGPIPRSFANLNKTKHFHMNNNSLSGQIPPELSRLPDLVHLLLDNNNLSGYLPPELSELPRLLILQLDNNHFDGGIPPSYGNMVRLLKLSLRNCSLQGPIPNLSRIPRLAYIDLSNNNLNGSIPAMNLSNEITTIDLSRNQLTGTIPPSFSGLPNLQRLSLFNNSLSGTVSSSIWQNRTFNSTEELTLDMENNRLSGISGSIDVPPNVTLRSANFLATLSSTKIFILCGLGSAEKLSLQGNPACSNVNASMSDFCSSSSALVSHLQSTPSNSTDDCPPQSCPTFYEYAPGSPLRCFCAAPLLIGYRLKSPGFSDFLAYFYPFEVYLTTGLEIKRFQLDLEYEWEKGPRLRMSLKIFPEYTGNNSNTFNRSEVLRIRSLFTQWEIPDSPIFGPYELLDFTLLEPYREFIPTTSSSSGISKGAVAGIVIGAIVGAVLLSAFVSLYILRLNRNKYRAVSRKRHRENFKKMETKEHPGKPSSGHGQGGYGKVYKGVFTDGTVVAIKRAQEGSLQGEKEFLTEIELLSRLHHRNLVSLLGFCDEEGEQMLVYEFMSNGTLRDHLSVTEKYKESFSFATRLRIALGSSKGILYLHTEANPPIFHRDIKATNILLDSRLVAKVADFGLSRLAPVADLEGVVPGHVSTVVKGTPGYLDPEYFLTHKLTDKSDVYSLGVVFLELLTGMHPITHGKNIVREVNIAYRSGMIFSVIDAKMGSYPSECVEKFVTLALKCCKEDTDERPSMVEVVRELENIWHMMPESESRTHDSMDIEHGKNVSSQTSSSTTKNPYVSSDISGSDLVSGVVPTICT
ncbi:hypothetical protein OSB04_001062 [Centaurea solstitialis]|uniref:non-specific serine/threonine protein kinase n=1 Tax=Centaurea solstitialis TaxID=347529 RepID=A0AA38U2Y5_9ASTR|nr:hypothetical protein OSB04_001062 [Centaurea solstitialis]